MKIAYGEMLLTFRLLPLNYKTLRPHRYKGYGNNRMILITECDREKR